MGKRNSKEINIKGVRIYICPEMYEMIQHCPRIAFDIVENYFYAEKMGFNKKQTQFIESINHAGLLMDDAMKSNSDNNDNKELMKALRETYELFMGNVDFIKDDDDLISFSMIGAYDNQYINALVMANCDSYLLADCDNMEIEARALLGSELIKMVAEAIEKETDPDKKLTMKKARAELIFAAPYLFGDVFDLGVEPRFGEDPIANIAARHGLSNYEKCSKAVSECISGIIDFYIDANKEHMDDDLAYLTVLSSFKYLPQEKVDSIKKTIKSNKGKETVARKMLLGYKKNDSQGGNKQGS